LKALTEVQTAPDAAAATEMALIRIGYAAELPPTDQLVRSAGSAPVSQPSRGSVAVVPPPPSPPPMRMSATGSSPAPARNEPTASAAPAAHAAARVAVQDFAAIVALARDNKEARLVYALEHWVHLVRFERGRLEIKLTEAAQATLPGELSDKLGKWTGERWIVSVSSAEGAPTLAAQKEAEDQSRRASAAQDPLLKAAMAVFPGARIVAVRDRDEFAPASESENEAS
jgi:DNA polymerase-3 subunit gamma/tau